MRHPAPAGAEPTKRFARGGDLRRPVVAAWLLASCEVAFVFAVAWGHFLSITERFRFVLGSFATATAIAVIVWVVVILLDAAEAKWAERVATSEDRRLRRLRRKEHVQPTRLQTRALGLLATPVAGVLFWSVTSGRRVEGASWREAGAVAFAIAVGLLTDRAARWLKQRYAFECSRRFGGLLFALASALVLADAVVLLRLYPAFHLALTIGAFVLAIAGAWVFGFPPGGALLRRGAWVVALLSLPAAAYSIWSVPQAPNVAFVVRERAPLFGEWVRRPNQGFSPSHEEASEPEESPLAVHGGIDLRDRDVLLITVDALRADRVGATPSITPELDALAEGSMVFTRAYTPTPHTSYALTSLLTGKFMREVLSLPDAPEDHPALPELLRRYGYRTAAFYPPAIFFVDADRFRALAARDFGFEYRKVMFAPAAARVRQLERYLDEEVEPGQPVFAWVHLFEPHEPYDPPAAFREGEGVEARYDGEVRAADAAIGDMVRAFRARRPDATVVVTADHGEEFGEHGGYYHGTTVYEEQVRVPLLWSSPGQVNAGTSDAPVEILDVATSLLSAIGIPRDVRMRGDDLGGVLAGEQDAGPSYAFSAVDPLHMVADERFKLICEGNECRLFDLRLDPRETQDRSAEDPERMRRMRAALSAHLGSIPRIEAMSVGEGEWPAALARASLGDVSAGPALVPLLGDPRAEVRAEAATALGSLGYAPAIATLARAMGADADEAVRREAALALLEIRHRSPELGSALGESSEQEARALVTGLLTTDHRWRAALALGASPAAIEALAEIVADGTELQQRDALKALEALGPRARRVAPVVATALEDVRLRPLAATALGAIGGRVASEALNAQLEVERYLPAREAELQALVRLVDRRAEVHARRLLGMNIPVPGGVAALVSFGGRPAGEGGTLSERMRVGVWDCSDVGCVPGEGAEIVWPARRAPADPARCVVWVEGGGVLSVGGVDHRVGPDGGQVAFDAPAPGDDGERRVAVSGDARVRAAVVVQAVAELPPPAPEPFEDADADADAEAEAGADAEADADADADAEADAEADADADAEAEAEAGADADADAEGGAEARADGAAVQ